MEIAISKPAKINHYLFSNSYLAKLFIPLVIEQFLVFMMSLVDSIAAAYIGEAAVSGVSLVEFVMALLIGLFAALATGGAVVAGQYMGRGEIENSNQAANQLIWFIGVASVVVMAAAYLAKALILDYLFGQITPEVRTHADTYFTIAAASIPGIALYHAGAAIFRAMGNSKLSMNIMIVMNLLNILGNVVLVYGFGFGTAGIGLTTFLSRVLAAAIVLSLLINTSHTLHLKKNLPRTVDRAMLRRILRIGIPYGLENGLFYFGRIVVLSLVATFGTAAIAANSVAGTIAIFTTLVGMAINLGMTTVIAACIGKGDYAQARYYHKKILAIVFAAHLALNALIIAFLPLILSIYNLSEVTAALATKIIVWHAVMAVIVWPLAYTQPITFRAANDAKYPMWVGIMTMLFCRIVMAYILGIYFEMGVFGTFAAMFIDWILKSVCFSYHYLSGKWMRAPAI